MHDFKPIFCCFTLLMEATVKCYNRWKCTTVCWTKAALLILTVMGRLKLLILLMNFKNCNVCKACPFNAARKWFQVTAKLSIVCICVKRAEVSLKRNEVITWVKNLNPIKNSLYLMETLFPLPSVSHKNSLFQK